MRRKMLLLCLLAGTLCLICSPAQAYLFNTGDPTSGSEGLGLNLNQSQLAGQLVLTAPWHITSLEAYFWNAFSGEFFTPQMETRIYADNAGTPGRLLESFQFSIPSLSFPTNAWYGTLNLDVTLAPDTYWFGIAYRSGLDQVSAPFRALGPDLFTLEAAFSGRSVDIGDWAVYPLPNKIGYRIGGNEVPIPGAVWLLGSGLLGLGGWRRFRKS